MIGYLGGPRIGALTYDVVHTYALPIALGVAGVLGESSLATQIALIWVAHIGLDRLLGYGPSTRPLSGHAPAARLARVELADTAVGARGGSIGQAITSSDRP